MHPHSFAVRPSTLPHQQPWYGRPVVVVRGRRRRSSGRRLDDEQPAAPAPAGAGAAANRASIVFVVVVVVFGVIALRPRSPLAFLCSLLFLLHAKFSSELRFPRAQTRGRWLYLYIFMCIHSLQLSTTREWRKKNFLKHFPRRNKFFHQFFPIDCTFHYTKFPDFI